MNKIQYILVACSLLLSEILLLLTNVIIEKSISKMFKLLKPNAVFPQQGTISFLIDAKIDRGPGPQLCDFVKK